MADDLRRRLERVFIEALIRNSLLKLCTGTLDKRAMSRIHFWQRVSLRSIPGEGANIDET